MAAGANAPAAAPDAQPCSGAASHAAQRDCLQSSSRQADARLALAEQAALARIELSNQRIDQLGNYTRGMPVRPPIQQP